MFHVKFSNTMFSYINDTGILYSGHSWEKINNRIFNQFLSRKMWSAKIHLYVLGWQLNRVT